MTEGPDSWGGLRVATHYQIRQRLEHDSWGERYLAVHLRTGAYYDVWVTAALEVSPRRRPWETDLLVGRWDLPHLLGARPLGFREQRALLCRPHCALTALDRMRHGPLPVAQVARWGGHILDGLKEAHRRGLAHGAVTPSAMALRGEGDEAHLIDFTQALLHGRRLWEPAPQGAVPVGLGGLVFLSPEQVMGSAKHPELADLYSVGVCLFALLLGEPPFLFDDLPSSLLAVIRGTPKRPLRQGRPEVPPPLADVIERAMALDPAQRFSSAEEMAAALGSAVRPTRR